jgi:hypothetical protein
MKSPTLDLGGAGGSFLSGLPPSNLGITLGNISSPFFMFYNFGKKLLFLL